MLAVKPKDETTVAIAIELDRSIHIRRVTSGLMVYSLSNNFGVEVE
jgi:hypothetical protein